MYELDIVLITVDDCNWIIFMHDEYLDRLNEGVEKKLVGTYTVRKDQPHNSTGEYHLHVYNKGNQIFALNKSGSAHDKSHGVKIPSQVYDAIRDKYPDFDLPANKVIESIALVRKLRKRRILSFDEFKKGKAGGNITQ